MWTINREGKCIIEIRKSTINVIDTDNPIELTEFFYEHYDSEQQALEKALEHIYKNQSKTKECV